MEREEERQYLSLRDKGPKLEIHEHDATTSGDDSDVASPTHTDDDDIGGDRDDFLSSEADDSLPQDGAVHPAMSKSDQLLRFKQLVNMERGPMRDSEMSTGGSDLPKSLIISETSDNNPAGSSGSGEESQPRAASARSSS